MYINPKRNAIQKKTTDLIWDLNSGNLLCRGGVLTILSLKNDCTFFEVNSKSYSDKKINKNTS